MNNKPLTESDKQPIRELVKNINSLDENSLSALMLLGRVYKSGHENGYRQGYNAGIAVGKAETK